MTTQLATMRGLCPRPSLCSSPARRPNREWVPAGQKLSGSEFPRSDNRPSMQRCCVHQGKTEKLLPRRTSTVTVAFNFPGGPRCRRKPLSTVTVTRGVARSTRRDDSMNSPCAPRATGTVDLSRFFLVFVLPGLRTEASWIRVEAPTGKTKSRCQRQAVWAKNIIIRT